MDDLDPLENVSETTTPLERAGNFFFERRLAGEQQFSIYVRHGWTGKDERLVDPAAMSRDTNTSVSIEGVSRDGGLLAYALKEGGADENSIHILDVKTKEDAGRRIARGALYRARVRNRRQELYYARNNKEGTLLFQHVMGTRPSRDTLVFGREYRGEELGPSDLFGPQITDDGKYMVIEIHRGVPAKRVDMVFRDLTKPGSPFEVLVWSLESRFEAVYAHNTWFVRTDYNSPNGRILAADPGVMPEAWKTIVPEGPDVIGALEHRWRQALREPAARCEDRNHRVHAGWQAGRQDRLRRDRIGFASGRQNHRSLRVLHVPVVHPAADHLPRRHDNRQARRLLPAQGSV